jgi:hypothetical protein
LTAWCGEVRSAQDFSQLGVRDLVRLEVDYVLEVVQQHDRAARGEGLQEGPHLGLRGGLRVAHHRLGSPAGVLGQELEEVLVQVRCSEAARADGVQVDDAVDVQRAQVVEQHAALQPFQDAADHRRLADAGATDAQQEPLRLVLQEVGDQLRFQDAVLEVTRRDGGRRVEELRAGFAAHRPSWLALALQGGGDARVGPLPGGIRIGDDWPLPGNFGLQLDDVGLDADLVLRTVRAAEVAAGVREAVLQLAEGPGGRFQERKIVPHVGQGLVEGAGEVEVLATLQAEGGGRPCGRTGSGRPAS